MREEIRQHAGGAQAYLTARNPSWRFVGRGHVPPGREQARRGAPVRVPGDLCQPTVGPGPRRSTRPWAGRCSNMRGQEPAGVAVAAGAHSAGGRAQRPGQGTGRFRRRVPSPGVVAARGAPLPAGHSDLRGERLDRPRSRLVEAPSSPAADRRCARSTAARQSTLGVDALLDFSVGVALDGEPLSEAETAGTAGLGGRAGPAQGQVGGGRPREAGRGARALANRRTQRAPQTACPSSKGCACWRAPRWSATRRRPSRKQTREWTGLTAGPACEATLNRLQVARRAADPELRRGCAPSCGPISTAAWAGCAS